MYTIYVLEDQRYSEIASIRYVGLTKDVYSRFAQHVQCAGNNQEKNAWVQELKSANIMLVMRTIETVETLEDAREREEYWIQHFLSQGSRILNQQIAPSFTYEDFLMAFGKSSPKPQPQQREREGTLVYAVTKREAAKRLHCAIKDVEQSIEKGEIRVYGHNQDKVLLSSLKNFVPMKKRLKIVNE